MHYVGCKPSRDGQLETLLATYRTTGADALEVQEALGRRLGAPGPLYFECCVWTSGVGWWKDTTGVHHRVEMISEETTEQDLRKVGTVFVEVHTLLELP